MNGKRKPNGYWSKEVVKAEALKYDRPSDFQKNSKGAYLSALRGNFLDEVCVHMTIKTYWTNEMLHQEALKHTTKSDFRKSSPTAYQIAYERAILEEICSHMEDMLVYWDNNLILVEALKYDNRTDFQQKSPSAYKAARRRGIIDEVCSHMPILKRDWTNDQLREEALKFKTKGEFKVHSESAYTLCINRKILDEVCSHMPAVSNEPYSTEEIQLEANKYKTRTEFYNGNGSAYNAAIRLNILDQICSHMEILHGFSLPEKEVCSFIKEFYPSVVENSKKIISPLELDIFIPELSLGIEYCGLYWHSEEHKDKNYHIHKMKFCNDKNIRLITIFEDEWRDRELQVKNFLLSVLNKNSINIGARKTQLKVVDNREAELFLEEHHIQGFCRFDIAFGLYHQQELVAVITGGRHHRQGQESIFVLNRLAFKMKVSVQGGASKLFKALKAYAQQKGYSTLISWSDSRWSEGKVYEKMGFTLEESLGADYSYIRKNNRISKQSCQKKNLIKKGAKGTMANTEQELALTLGYHRIWDCGKKRWSMKI